MMSARDIELQKGRRYKAEAKRLREVSNAEFSRVMKPFQAHAHGPAVQGPAAQGPAAQGPAAQGQAAQGPPVPVPAAPGPTVQERDMIREVRDAQLSSAMMTLFQAQTQGPAAPGPTVPERDMIREVRDAQFSGAVMTLFQAHAQGPAAQGPRVPVPAAPLPTVQKPFWNCTHVRELEAHPDITRPEYRVGSVMEITDDVHALLAQYIGCVCMIKHIYQFLSGPQSCFMGMVVSFKATTPTAKAEMAAVVDSYLDSITKQAMLTHGIIIQPGELFIGRKHYLKTCLMGTSLSRIGNPESSKRKHEKCDSTHAPQKNQAPIRQQYQDAFDLLLDADKDLDAIEQLTAMQQSNAGKQPVPNEQAPDSDDDSDDEEPGGLEIDDDSTY